MAPYPHTALEQLEENLWVVEGSIPKNPLKRRMSIVQLSDGRLVLHSPILMDETSMAQMEAKGPVGFVIIPNGYHRIDARAFADRYPEAKILCPRESEKRIAEVVRIDGYLDAFVEDPALAVEVLNGGKVGEGVLIVRSNAGVSLVFNDTLFNVHQVEGAFRRFMLRMAGSFGGPKVTPLGRLILVRDKRKLASHLHRLADRPNLRHLIPGHGDVISADVNEALRSVAERLL